MSSLPADIRTCGQAKKDQLRKEGKLLTPKQKAEKAAAELRLKALVGTEGLVVAGLQKNGDGEAPKKVSYGKKKPFKKGPAAAEPEATPEVKEPEPAPAPVEEEKAKSAEASDDEDVKDDWDASDSEKAESVKDEWDASSEEEEEAKPEPVKAAPTPAPAPAKSKHFDDEPVLNFAHDFASQPTARQHPRSRLASNLLPSSPLSPVRPHLPPRPALSLPRREARLLLSRSPLRRRSRTTVQTRIQMTIPRTTRTTIRTTTRMMIRARTSMA